MKIRLERTGGFAGVPLTTALDTETLPSEEAEHLIRMIEDAGLLDAPPSTHASSRGRADAFTYVLVIEIDAERREFEIAETAADEMLRPLLEWLTKVARRCRDDA